MPRIRSIKPGFWTDSKMVRLTPYARLFYIGTWNFALCEKGHLPDDAFELKLQILPADNVDVDELLEELIGAGRIERRKTRDGSTYLCVTRLSNHNKSDARWATTCQYCIEESSADDDETHGDSGESQRASDESQGGTESHGETQPRKGIGREGKGDICAPDEPAHASETFTLDQEELVPPTYEIGSDDDPKWREFWSTYPTKRGKKEARRAYTLAVTGEWTEPNSQRKRPKVHPDDLIEAARSYANRVRRERVETRHIKMAQGWINAERWRDELEADLQAEQDRGVDIWALPTRCGRSSSPGSTASRRPRTGSPPAARPTRTTRRRCRSPRAASTRSCCTATPDATPTTSSRRSVSSGPTCRSRARNAPGRPPASEP